MRGNTVRKIQSRHIRIAVTVVISGAILYAIMSIIDNIGLVYESVGAAISFILRVLTPVLIGFVITFLLSRPSDFLTHLIMKIKFFSRHKKGAHGIGVFLAFIIFLALIILFLYMMVPGIVDSVGSITQEIPHYAQSVDKMLGDLSKNESIAQVLKFIGIDVTQTNSISSIVSEFWTDITAFVQNITGYIFGFIINTGLFLYNFVLGLFFSIYMLLFKNELKTQLRIMSKNVFRSWHYKLMFVVDITDDMFYKFIVGKGICSLAVGILTFIICSLLGFKYSPLISLIIAVTNMIPTFGPFIGAIPAILLSLMTAPVFALYMIIIIIGLQMVDGNILGPRVLGESMGLNGFWIMFSIIVMGALFGVLGMLIAAPLFGVLRILIKNWIYKKNHGALEGEAEFNASMQRFRQWTSRKKKDEGSAKTA
jgi:predicted PurR-regulated permease PerM